MKDSSDVKEDGESPSDLGNGMRKLEKWEYFFSSSSKPSFRL